MFGNRLAKSVLSLLVLIAAGVIYIAIPTFGKTYSVNVAAVQTALDGLSLPLVFTDPRLKLKLVERKPTHMEWQLSNGRGPSVRVIAQFDAPNADETTVTITIVPPDLGEREPSMLAKASLKKLFEGAFKEQIDATLENRSFEYYRIYPELAVAMAINVNPNAIVRNVEKIAAADQKRARNNIAKAYEDEAAGRIKPLDMR